MCCHYTKFMVTPGQLDRNQRSSCSVECVACKHERVASAYMNASWFSFGEFPFRHKGLYLGRFLNKECRSL